MPRTNHLGDPLPTPTYVEGQLLGRGRIMQQLLILHLPDRPAEVFPRAVRAHGVAVSNPDPNMLRAQLPARIADLAGAITIVCVDQVRNRQELVERVQRAPGLQVRGPVIVAWVQFLQHNEEEELAIDPDALREYERMGPAPHVPEPLLRTALAPTDPDVAHVLRSTFLHDRTGAAGVRQVQDTLAAERGTVRGGPAMNDTGQGAQEPARNPAAELGKPLSLLVFDMDKCFTTWHRTGMIMLVLHRHTYC